MLILSKDFILIERQSFAEHLFEAAVHPRRTAHPNFTQVLLTNLLREENVEALFRLLDGVVLRELLRRAVAEAEKEAEFGTVLQQKKDLMQSDFMDVFDAVERSHKLKAESVEGFQVENGILAEDGSGNPWLSLVQKGVFEEQINEVAEGKQSRPTDHHDNSAFRQVLQLQSLAPLRAQLKGFILHV